MGASSQTPRIDPGKARDAVLSALRRSRGRVTVGDVATATGLASTQAEAVLKSLLSTHRGHLEVSDDGDLVYRFDPRGMRRDEKTAWERVKAGAWAAFKLGFKVWIMVTLVVYFALFVALILAAVVAAASRGSSDDNRRSRALPIRLDWLWLVFYSPDYRRGRRYYGYRDEGAGRVPFYRKVFAFVFGPDRMAVDPLQRDREILALVRSRGGVVSALDLMEHYGLRRGDAEEEMGRLMGAHLGDVEVSEDGQIYYTFSEVMLSTERSLTGAAPRKAWQRLEQPLLLTGNTSGSNTLIVFLNGFNLLAAATAPGFIFPQLGLDGPAAWIGLVWVPLAFSVTFFTVPLLRAIKLAKENARLHAINARRLLLGEAFTAAERQRPLAERAALATVDGTLRQKGLPAPAATLQGELKHVVLDLEAEVAATDDDVVYSFASVLAIRKGAAQMRQSLRLDQRKVGEIVYSTADTVEEEQARQARVEEREFEEALAAGGPKRGWN